MKLKRPTKIEVKESGIHGLGVFAIEDIEANEIIEECHLLTVREKIPKDSITLDPTPEYRPLEDYLFRWPPTGVDWDDVDSQMKLKKRDRVVLEWELENGKILRAIHPDETMVLLLGYGSIYNHSENSNAGWRHHPNIRAYQFYAIKDIKKGEEICTNYGKRYTMERTAGKKVKTSIR